MSEEESIKLADGTDISNLNNAELIAKGNEAKDALAAMKKDHKDQLQTPTADLERLAGEAGRRLQKEGQNHMSAPGSGRAEIRTTERFKIDDADKFKEHIKESGDWQLANLSANADSTREYIDEFSDMPPGVGRSATQQVVFTRGK